MVSRWGGLSLTCSRRVSLVFTRIAGLDELPESGNRAFAVNDLSVLVCRSGSGVFVVENRCSHQLAELAGGKVKGCYLFCPLHGVRFDLRDGSPSGTLTKKPITIYPSSVTDGAVYAELPA